MTLPEAAYPADVVTSATKAGSYIGYSGKKKNRSLGYLLSFFRAALAG